ncbi:protein TIC 22, chloroplastic isoform X2 [Phalaenopsis equestris]|uniref:protein TIC 22, chloroplastic isoform X2 n=1 Tax=Phalaenopsis equestris TaxID=78828 RepID=UPI0009E48BE9|nr:protein TIC 22, chloroplastic isoform X2 [Phalaenopsis equestris]
MPGSSVTFPLSAVSMDSSSSSPPPILNPIASLSSFLHHQLCRFSADLSTRLAAVHRQAIVAISSPAEFPFAALSMAAQGRHAFEIALSTDYISRTLTGTAVYTVGNANNEFVLVSDPHNGARSISLLCFREEDAQALLSQVQLRQPILGRGARVVPINLDQVEGIAFRFLPDPLQIKNALELKSADRSRGFDGVPVFQSELLVIKKKNRRYCPIYFRKEDLERELLKASRGPRGPGLSQHIMVGSLEDVLKKMEVNDNNSGWDDLIFIPPGKSYTQHVGEAASG